MQQDISLDVISTDILQLCLISPTGLPVLSKIGSSRTSIAGEPQLLSSLSKLQRIRALRSELFSVKRERDKYAIPLDRNVKREFTGLSVDSVRERAAVAQIEADIAFDELYGHLASPKELKRRQSEYTAGDAMTAVENSTAVIARLSNELSELRRQIYVSRSEIKLRHEENKAVTARLVSLIHDQKQQTKSAIPGDAQMRILSCKESYASATQKLETLKPIILGIVLGSGLDWASDPNLREIVLECSNNDSEDSENDYDDYFDFEDEF
ncbi:uncharacterized protein V2V93DRAFT_376153 [Kockiozyma suomiensis]|uniref:uncharacterized protein n=1 Tax=Kockiozyma suomiensis TaxID=1337062 RepID=UPI0033434DED